MRASQEAAFVRRSATQLKQGQGRASEHLSSTATMAARCMRVHNLKAVLNEVGVREYMGQHVLAPAFARIHEAQSPASICVSSCWL